MTDENKLIMVLWHCTILATQHLKDTASAFKEVQFTPEQEAAMHTHIAVVRLCHDLGMVLEQQALNAMVKTGRDPKDYTPPWLPVPEKSDQTPDLPGTSKIGDL